MGVKSEEISWCYYYVLTSPEYSIPSTEHSVAPHAVDHPTTQPRRSQDS